MTMKTFSSSVSATQAESVDKGAFTPAYRIPHVAHPLSAASRTLFKVVSTNAPLPKVEDPLVEGDLERIVSCCCFRLSRIAASLHILGLHERCRAAHIQGKRSGWHRCRLSLTEDGAMSQNCSLNGGR